MWNARNPRPARVAGLPPRLAGREAPRRFIAALLTAMLVASAFAPSFAADEGSSLAGKVNLNTATVQELQLLPGVGEVRASAIVDLRKQKGGFKSLDELEDVKGVGPAMMERLRPHLTLPGKTTAHRS